MRRFRHSSIVRCFALPFSLLLWLDACYNWIPGGSPPVEFLAQAERPESERDHLRLRVGMEREVKGKLTALTPDSVTIRGSESTVFLAVEDVSQVQLRRFSTGKTVGLSLGIVAVLFGAAFALFAAGWDDGVAVPAR
jgi:hypothetical protein